MELYGRGSGETGDIVRDAICVALSGQREPARPKPDEIERLKA
ncbi:hypothetical protein [Aureimonas altamirensis]|nr:hypothetical protein [Aureimonas altamirensis]